MDDLSHWDVANDFSPEEAAALAVEVDPAQPGYVRSKSSPLYMRMRDCYDRRVNWYKFQFEAGDFRVTQLPDMLESVEMHRLASTINPDDSPAFSIWLDDEKVSRFDTQRFTRVEMGRWLSAIGVPSGYLFDPAKSKVTIVADKPLFKRERDTLLTIIAALAKEGKINFDQPGKAALSIENLTDKLGAHISKRAIEEHLKKIPDALATRMK